MVYARGKRITPNQDPDNFVEKFFHSSKELEAGVVFFLNFHWFAMKQGM